MNVFKKIKAYFQLRRAVEMADNAHVSDHHRYYVMPNFDGKLFVMDRDNFKGMKKKHYIPQNCTIRDLERECFYCTPYGNGKGELPKEVVEKKKQDFYRWYKMFH